MMVTIAVISVVSLLSSMLLCQPTNDSTDNMDSLFVCNNYRSCSNHSLSFSDGDFVCSCSPNCAKFGDCCLDASIQDQLLQEDNAYRCGRPNFLPKDNSNRWMVTSCPRLWKDHFTRYMCENSAYFEKKIQSIPVFSWTTNTTYRNVYCVVCNGETIDSSVHWWRLEMECNAKDSNTTAKQMFTGYSCFAVTTFPIPYEKEYSKIDVKAFCQLTNDNSCSFSNKNNSLHKKCAQYFAPITVNNMVYKNKFCAQCSHFTTDFKTPNCTDANTLLDKKFIYENEQVEVDNFLLKIETNEKMLNRCEDNKYISVRWAAFNSSNSLFSEETECVRILDNQKNYTTVPQLECGVHSSCSGPDKARPSPLYCNCQDNCPLFGDCCYDFPDKIRPAVTTSLQLIERLQCLNPFPVANTTQDHYFMIADCPSSWKISEINDLCNYVDFANVTQSLPVWSATSKMTYRNIYCAICNKDVDDLKSWEVSFHYCPHYYSEEMSITEILSQCRERTYRQPFVPKVFGSFVDEVRVCSQFIKSKCQMNTDLEVRIKCSTYFAPVQVVKHLTDNTLLYKNEFCALCNGYLYQNLQCPNLKTIFHEFYPLIRYNPSPGQGGYGGYDILLKIDFSGGINQIGPSLSCPEGYSSLRWTRDFYHEIDGNSSIHVCVKNWNANFSDFSYNNSDQHCSSGTTLFDLENIDKQNTVTVKGSNITFKAGTYILLENESVLVCTTDEIRKDEDVPKTLLSMICSIISLVALLIKIVVHFAFKEPNTIPKLSILLLSCSLFTAQLVLLVGVQQTMYLKLCIFLASLTHYAFLCTFCWMNVLAYDIFRKFNQLRVVSRHFSKKRFTCYNLYAWLMPLPVVITAIVFDNVTVVEELKPRFARFHCWFDSRKSLFVFFGVPLALILLLNIYFFVMTAVRIFMSSRDSRIARENTEKKSTVLFFLYIKLALLIGLTWVMGIIAAYAHSLILSYFHIVLNALQGVFILLAFTKMPSFNSKSQFKVYGPLNDVKIAKTNSTGITDDSKNGIFLIHM